MLRHTIIVSSILSFFIAPNWGQEENRVNFELFVYDEPVAKVEVIVPKSWKEEFKDLSLGSAEQKQKLSVLLETSVLSALQLKVDGRELPTPNPEMAWLLPKQEGGGYYEVQDVAKASHFGFVWTLDRSIRKQLEVILENPVFGEKGLYQSLKNSASAETGLVQTYPANLQFELSHKFKAPLALANSPDALRSLSPRVGPSPRTILWIVLGLLFLILQVRKSRSISTRGAIIAVLAIFLVVGLWFAISPYLKIPNKPYLSKLPQNRKEEVSKDKLAQQWFEGFLTSLQTPNRPNAQGYLASYQPWAEAVEAGATPQDEMGLFQRLWKVVSFAQQLAPEYEERGLRQYEWNAASEWWAWGGADLKVITGKVRFDTLHEPVPSAAIMDLQIMKME